MKRFAAALMITGAALFAGAGAASATGYNEGASAGVDNPTPAAGASFTVVVSDCTVGTTVDFSFQGQDATDVADADGASATFTAPSAAGNYTGIATCGDVVLSFGITVTAAATTTAAPGGELPATGSSGTSSAMGIAGMLLVAGAAMFGVAQVRRRQATA